MDALALLLERARVPGLSLAVVTPSGVELSHAGVANAATQAAVDTETVFDAASLGKPVFAHAVLQLIDSGHLSMETRLTEHVPDYVTDDPRSRTVTVAHALCHATGLPNWRSVEVPLRTHFAPGERFSYSGEGYTWLQRAVERIANTPLDVLMNRLVFEPLRMTRSSYVWRPPFEANHAFPHDGSRIPGAKRKPAEPMAAFSLHTTAADIARFLRAVLTGARLKPETAALWLSPQMPVRRRGISGLRPEGPEIATGVAWGLGWGLEPARGTFFQWGDSDQGRHKTFAIGSASQQKAMAILTNGVHGMAVVPTLIDSLFPGDHPGLDWLGYPRLPE